MRKTSNIAEFQRLCSIGADGTVLLPNLLRSLHEILPTSHNAFFWLNSAYNPTGGYHEVASHAPYAQHYVMSFANNLEAEAIPPLKKIVQTPNEIYLSSAKSRQVGNSKLYDEVWRPINCFHVAEAAVGKGVLMLIREKVDRPFQEVDVQVIQNILPHMRAAFSSENKDAESYIGVDDQECIIVDEHGKIEYKTSGVDRLLNFCSGSHFVTNDVHLNTWKCDAQKILKEIGTRIGRIDRGVQSLPATHVHRNPWGEFEFTGRILGDLNQSDCGRYAVFIKHRVQTNLWYFDAIKLLPLTEKEKDIAFLSVTGDLSKTDIAHKLQISHHTVSTHVRHIYQKLNIASREELKRKIAGLGKP